MIWSDVRPGDMIMWNWSTPRRTSYFMDMIVAVVPLDDEYIALTLYTLFGSGAMGCKTITTLTVNASWPLSDEFCVKVQ